MGGASETESLEAGLGLGSVVGREPRAESTEAGSMESTPRLVLPQASESTGLDGSVCGIFDCCKRWRRVAAPPREDPTRARRGLQDVFRSAPRAPTSANTIQQQLQRRRRRFNKAVEMLCLILIIGGVDLMLWFDNVIFRAFCFGMMLSALLIYHKVYRRRNRSLEQLSAAERSNTMRDLASKFPVVEGLADSPVPADSVSCPICLDAFEVGTDEMILPCFHRFHCSCASQWLRDNEQCPLCRCDLLDAVQQINSL